MIKSLSALYKTYGNPLDVLDLVEETIPTPGPYQTLVKMERAVINPSDLGTIAGTYGAARKPPHAAGWEGCGIVEQVGEGAPYVVGQRVAIVAGGPTWSQYVLAEKDGLIVLPNDIPVDQAAGVVVNPMTALRLMEDFVNLKPGSWVIQNAGNSAVSVCFTQLAKSRGINTISMVRRPELETFLIDQGASVVVPDNSKIWEEAKKITAGAGLVLALNSIGGASALALARALNTDGVHVTYGGASGETIRFPTRELIFQGITLKGFWRNRWQKETPADQIREEYKKLLKGFSEGWLKTPVDSVFPLTQIKEALKRANDPTRNGKVLLDTTL